MKYKFHLADIVLLFFVLTTLGDIVSTIITANKHTIDLETNPIMVVLGLPLWGLFALKFLMLGLFLLIMLKTYPRCHIYLRYYLVFFLCFITLMQLAVTVSNMQIYNLDKGDINPLPKEERAQAYKEGVGDMKVFAIIEPEIQTKSGQKVQVPLMTYLVILGMFFFIVWVSFERKHHIGVF